MLRNRCYRHRTEYNWNKYKIQRNYVTSLRKKSIRNYFRNKCEQNNSKDNFWKIMIPFLSDKNNKSNENIILRENDNVLTNPKEVSECFNDFYINIASQIGFSDTVPCDENGNILLNEILHKHKNHESVVTIKTYRNRTDIFNFKHVNVNDVCKIIKTLDVKKAMGYDNIPAKLLKLSSDVLGPVITPIINKCIDDCIFPSDLKYAEVSSIFKKSDKLNKENYRPISILRIISKVFERAFANQMTVFFDTIFNPLLSAYRLGYGCHDLLLKYIETWKSALDSNLYVGSVMMDLSKAFDCLPHKLLIC